MCKLYYAKEYEGVPYEQHAFVSFKFNGNSIIAVNTVDKHVGWRESGHYPLPDGYEFVLEYK